jgi:hypothetical protein
MKRVPFWISVSLIFLSGFTLVSCSKDKYTTKPQLTIKSINTTIPPGGELTVILQYTSKKGDLGGGYFVAIRERLNQRPLPPGTSNNDTASGPIPAFPNQSKAEFQFTEGWADYLHQSDQEDDTINFRIAAIDKSGNSSDTLTTPTIVVLHQ